MSGYGLFQPSTLGMRSQAHKLNTIGYNVANVNTGGFKRIDTNFQTVLSDKIDGNSDYGGVKPFGRSTNDVQGLITQSPRALDLAISGDGFFQVRPSLTDTTEIYFTRDGSFEINTVDGQTSSVTADDGNTITVANGYLVDKNGMFVMGVAASTDGTFSSASAAPMRVDQYAFTDTGQATGTASLEFNLPAGDSFGDPAHTFALQVFDSNATPRTVNFDFTKSSTDNTWRIDARGDNLTTNTFSTSTSVSFTASTAATMNFSSNGNTLRVQDASNIGIPGTFSNLRVGDSITIAGSTTTVGTAMVTNDGTFTIASILDDGATLTFNESVTTAPDVTGGTATATDTSSTPLTFSSSGQLTSTSPLTFTASWGSAGTTAAGTSSFSLDISNMSQFAGDFTPFRSSQDGFARADITDISFDDAGHVVGTFSDGTERNIYKIPLYDFQNANGLRSSNGLLFEQTTESGTAVAFFADESSKADFATNAVEISNVDIALEFTQMIQTQTAYNMSAQTFKTIDEMTTVARDLKA